MSTNVKGNTAAKSTNSTGAKGAAQQSSSKISQIVGGNFILPGESVQEFQQACEQVIQELGAQTQLQIYLAEQIFHSMWWIRRYERQKRACVISAMVDVIKGFSMSAHPGQALTELFELGHWDDPAVLKEVKAKGLTVEGLVQKATSQVKDRLMQLDQSVALKMHTLTQMQKSYEALVNRSVMQERLKLQNDLLKRDLLAIDTPVVKDLKTQAQQLGHEDNTWEPEYDER